MEPDCFSGFKRGNCIILLHFWLFLGIVLVHHRGMIGYIATLGKSLLIGTKYRQNPLAIAALVINVDCFVASPAHYGAGEGVALAQVLFRIKLIRPCSTGNSERYQAFRHKEF